MKRNSDERNCLNILKIQTEETIYFIMMANYILKCEK